MKIRNLVADVLVCAFTLISFIIYAHATYSNNSLISYLSVFVYVIPHLIVTVQKLEEEYMPPQVLKLNISAIIIGTMVVVGSLTLMALGIDNFSYLKFIMIICSSIFAIRSVCVMIIAIKLYYNLHNSIYRIMEG